jgi:hypothetical protein
MIYSQFFIIIGLAINTVASLVMLFPYLKITRNVDDDFILNMNKEGDCTQKKHRRDRKLGLVGFSLFFIGFVFQMVGLLIT